MPDKVVDCSAIAAVLFGEPEGAAVLPRVEGARLFAPFSLGFELANTCAVKSRKRPDEAAGLQRRWSDRAALNIETVDVDLDATLELALATGLSAYDASYLWLSRELGAELITLDEKLARAAAAS